MNKIKRDETAVCELFLYCSMQFINFEEGVGLLFYTCIGFWQMARIVHYTNLGTVYLYIQDVLSKRINSRSFSEQLIIYLYIMFMMTLFLSLYYIQSCITHRILNFYIYFHTCHINDTAEFRRLGIKVLTRES